MMATVPHVCLSGMYEISRRWIFVQLSVPEQLCMHGHWLRKKYHGCPSTCCGIVSPFFNFSENACLSICFLFDITVSTAFDKPINGR